MNNKTELPLLPPSLSFIYSTLPDNYKRLFIKIYRWLWSYALNKRTYMRRGAVLYYYWAVDISRLRLGLTTSELALLSYLYQITNEGANYIHSDMVYDSKVLPNLQQVSKLEVLKRIKRKGYICRSYRDPSAPYLALSFASHPVFITLTGSGVAVIKRIKEDLYDIVYHHSLDDITGVNKKP